MNNKTINDIPVTKITVSPMLFYLCFSSVLFCVIISSISFFQGKVSTIRCFVLFAVMCLSLMVLVIMYYFLGKDYIIDIRDEIDSKQKKLEEEKNLVKKEKMKDYNIGLKTMKEKLTEDYETKIGDRDKKISMQQTQIKKDKGIIENKDEEITEIMSELKEQKDRLLDQHRQEIDELEEKKDNFENEKKNEISNMKERITELEQDNEELEENVDSLNNELRERYGDWKQINDTLYKAWNEDKMEWIIFELPKNYDPEDVVKIERGMEIDSKGHKIPVELADLIRDEQKGGKTKPDVDLRDVTPAVRTVYDSMKKENPYSFSEITRNAGLSKPAISSALKVLIAKNMVEHDEENKIYMRIT